MIATLLSSFWGKCLATFVLSMAPIVELRGGLPFGVSLGLEYHIALVFAILGNMVPVPFIIVYIRKIFHWIRKRGGWCERLITKLERKAHLNGRKVKKYRALGLLLLVAIPLPGTGAWTGALVAAFLDMRLKEAVPVIFLGVVIAGLLVSGLTYGAASFFM